MQSGRAVEPLLSPSPAERRHYIPVIVQRRFPGRKLLLKTREKNAARLCVPGGSAIRSSVEGRAALKASYSRAMAASVGKPSGDARSRAACPAETARGGRPLRPKPRCFRPSGSPVAARRASLVRQARRSRRRRVLEAPGSRKPKKLRSEHGERSFPAFGSSNPSFPGRPQDRSAAEAAGAGRPKTARPVVRSGVRL